MINDVFQSNTIYCLRVDVTSNKYFLNQNIWLDHKFHYNKIIKNSHLQFILLLSTKDSSYNEDFLTVGLHIISYHSFFPISLFIFII